MDDCEKADNVEVTHAPEASPQRTEPPNKSNGATTNPLLFPGLGGLRGRVRQKRA